MWPWTRFSDITPRAVGWLGLFALAALGLFALAALGLAAGGWARRRAGSTLAGVLVGAGAVCAPATLEAASYLLEAPWFALAFAWMLAAASGDRPAQTWVAASWLAAVRPEGMLVAPVVVAWVAHRTGRGAWRGVLLGALPGAVLSLLRRVLFGAWVPNTFPAKSSDRRWPGRPLIECEPSIAAPRSPGRVARKPPNSSPTVIRTGKWTRLTHLGLRSEPPALAPARPPPQMQFA